LSGLCYVRMNMAQTELADFKLEVAENTRKAEAEARAKEQEMQRNAEQITKNATQRQTVLEGRLANVNAVATGLRDQILASNARPAPTNPESATYAREARTARELLGACAEEYRSVAEGADKLRDQVIGLQAFATDVCKAPQ
jgi:hypothetical protein